MRSTLSVVDTVIDYRIEFVPHTSCDCFEEFLSVVSLRLPAVKATLDP